MRFVLLRKCFLLSGKMIRAVRSLRIFLFDYVFYVFGVTIGCILRIKEDGMNDEEDSPLLKISFGSEKGEFSGEGGAEPEDKVIRSVSPNTSEYQFTAGREIHGFIEEPESITYVLNEFYAENPPDEFSGEYLPVDSEKAEVLGKGEPEILSDYGHGDSEEEEDEIESENNNMETREVNFVREAMDEEKWDYFVGGLGAEQQMKHEIENSNEIDSQFFANLPEVHLIGEDYSPPDAGSDLISSSDEGRESEKVGETEETFSDSDIKIGSKEELSRDQFCRLDDDHVELKLQTHYSIPACAEIPPFEDSKKLKQEDERENPEEPSVMGCDEEDEPEILPEQHEDVIEQLKRELRRVRTGGLPTIWEEGSEPEFSITIQGLKPWKSDQKHQRKHQMEEIQKVYNAYKEKMRKLDVLNNQTMQAIGFLQLRNQNRSAWSEKSSVPADKSSISHKLWARKSQKSITDSSLKFNGDLRKELELVYVGQVCLSWEILNWQHRKVLELQEHDSEGLRRCMTNRVASDFQTFQIFVERFLESDRFHGSRVENYVKNRHVMRRFLQVPAISDGCMEEKNQTKTKHANIGGYRAEMIEQSKEIFRQFIRTDEDEGNQSQIDLEDPSDSGLLDDARAALHKVFYYNQFPVTISSLCTTISSALYYSDLGTIWSKSGRIDKLLYPLKCRRRFPSFDNFVCMQKEKKLKDIVRSRKCIVKKLQRNKTGRANEEDTLVVAEVELKLVSRVLRMSKLTKSQLHWCCQKLNQVVFSKGKTFVEVEPNFLPFPF